MGLLDSVIGAIGQAQGGPGQADLLGAITGLLGPGDGTTGAGLGGLAGLVALFQQAGLGDIVNSWISTGANLPISPQQLGSVLGNDRVAGMAGQLGLDAGGLLGQLSQLLPQVVDQLTPGGRLPAGDAGGLGELGGLAGMLGGLLRR